MHGSADTLGQWLDTWLFRKRQAGLSPATISSYEFAVKNHIPEYLKHVQLRKLNKTRSRSG